MPTDVQFKYELGKHLTELERKLELLRNEEYEKLEKEYLKEYRIFRQVWKINRKQYKKEGVKS